MSLLKKLKAELAFENPEERMAYYHNTASEYYKTLPDEMSHPRIEGAKFGMRTENARLRELHGLLCECVGALEKFRNEPKDWRVPKGPGGQDRYVGLPPGFRYFDDALSRLESYLEKREG